ncbi:hypothetical protein DV738_g3851, partial [Chaetothyriales sp. CBS 135597]
MPPIKGGTWPPPPIAALFVVVFDHRKGYVLQWHRNLANVQVEGVVEFKSLPSGLHRVHEDVIYFVHGNYVGVSAYVNRPDTTAQRDARMLAVGVLVPLHHGRMGKSWLHAERLKQLATEQINNHRDGNTSVQSLEGYWQEHRVVGVNNGYQANNHRVMSALSVFIPDAAVHPLPPHHPAAALLEMVTLFGPLIFPLYRAALLRKRILLLTDAPVEFACSMVYNLSVLSSLPTPLLAYLPGAGAAPRASLLRRVPTLFNVGITDIDDLSQRSSFADGWIACTTDEVLATKPQLYDIAVYLPNKDSSLAGQKKTYPRIVLSSGGEDAAKQRLPQTHPPSWSRVAYTSLLWWASAGDRRSGLTADEEEEEMERDSLLFDIRDDGDGRTKEVVLVAYFRRLTAILFQTRPDGWQSKDSRPEENSDDTTASANHSHHSIEHHHQPSFTEDDQTRPLLLRKSLDLGDDYDDDTLIFTPDDISAMGLDSWSRNDSDFVEELLRVWWKRNATVRSARVECCGLRIL